jgi:hypothetical protein
MNKQEIIETVVERMVKQNKRSYLGDCLYHDKKNNTKCAVGCLIEDNDILETMDNCTFSDDGTISTVCFIVEGVPDYICKNLDILSKLQDLHDGYSESYFGNEFKEYFSEGAKRIAKEFNLKVTWA